MFFAIHRLLADVGDVRVKNLETVELDFQLVAVQRKLLAVPLADGPQIAALRG